jgi:hypothetical protein
MEEALRERRQEPQQKVQTRAQIQKLGASASTVCDNQI